MPRRPDGPGGGAGQGGLPRDVPGQQGGQAGHIHGGQAEVGGGRRLVGGEGGADVAGGEAGGFGPGDVAGAVVAHHDAAGGVEPLFRKQDVEKAPVGLFAAVVGGEVHPVECAGQAQRPHLIGGEDGLRVAEQEQPPAPAAEGAQHLEGAVVQPQPVGGHGPEELSRMEGEGFVGIRPAAAEQLEKDPAQLDLGVGFVAVLPQGGQAGFPRFDQPVVGRAQLLRGIPRPVIAVEPGQGGPGGGSVLVGVDVHQGAVEVEDVVLIRQSAHGKNLLFKAAGAVFVHPTTAAGRCQSGEGRAAVYIGRQVWYPYFDKGGNDHADCGTEEHLHLLPRGQAQGADHEL